MSTTPNQIAEQMKSKGMNTAQIMVALFEANISLKNIASSGSVLNHAIAMDGQAANLRKKLQGDYKLTLDKLKDLATATEDNITKLSTVKTTASLSDGLRKQIEPHTKDLMDLEEKRVAMYEAAQAFIVKMRDAFAKFSVEMEKTKDTPFVKNEMKKLIDELQRSTTDAKKTFEGKNIGTIEQVLITLNSEAAKNTAANGLTTTVPRMSGHS